MIDFIKVLSFASLVSIRNTAVRASGGFEFSGAFSVEFKRRKSGGIAGKSLGEHFFYPGLSRMEHSYTFNISSKVTFGGTSAVDYGNGLSYITISADLYPHYEGKPVRNPDVSVTGFNTASATSVLSGVGSDFADSLNPVRKPGYIEIMDIIWLFSRSRRDNSGFRDYPDTLLGVIYPNAGDIRLQAELSALNDLSLEDCEMVFHDYDRDEHWECALDAQNGFNISQANDRPMVYVVTIKLTGLRQLSKEKKIIRPALPNVRAMLNTALFDLAGLLKDLSSDMKSLADIPGAFRDLQKYKTLLIQDIKNFNASVRSSMDKIRNRVKKTDDQRKKILELFLNSKAPAGSIPKLDGINVSFPPMEYVTNPLTIGTLDLFPYADDSTVFELNNLQTVLAVVDAAMVQALNQLNVSSMSNFHTVLPGDSFISLADQFLTGPGDFGQLITLNNGNPIQPGDVIPIPSSTISIPDLGNVGILMTIPPITSIDDLTEFLELALLGTDLTPDLVSNANADLGIITGIDSLIDTILDILNNIPGTVPLHPDFSPLDIIGLPNEMILSLSLPRQIIEAVMQEQGVKSTKIQNLVFDGGSLKISLKIVPITDGQPVVINVERTANRLIK